MYCHANIQLHSSVYTGGNSAATGVSISGSATGQLALDETQPQQHAL